MKRRTLFYLLLLTPIFYGFVSEPKEIETLRIMLGQKRYSMQVSFILYKNIELKDTLEMEKIQFNVFEKSLHYQAGPFEAFSDGKYSVVINHQNKYVLVNNVPKEEKIRGKITFPENFLDSIKVEDYEVKLISNNGQYVTYSFKSKDNESPINYFYFTLDAKNNKPSRVMIIYRKELPQLLGSIIRNRKELDKNNQPVLRINYDKFDYLLNADPKAYSYKDLVQINHKHVKSLNGLANYKILNYLN